MLPTRTSSQATWGYCILMCGVPQNNGLPPCHSIAVTSPSKDSLDASLSAVLQPAYLAKRRKWGQPVSVRAEHEGSGGSLQSLMGELLLKAGVRLPLSPWLCKPCALACCPSESFLFRVFVLNRPQHTLPIGAPHHWLFSVRAV